MDEEARPQRALVGSIIERKRPSVFDHPNRSASLPSGASTKTGFPAVQHRSHRSRSAFLRAREEAKTRPARDAGTPAIVNVSAQADLQSAASGSGAAGKEDWRKQMESENLKYVTSMTEEERQEGREEILQRFGPGIEDTLRRAKEARDRKVQHETRSETPLIQDDSDDEGPPRLAPPSLPPPANPAISAISQSQPGSGASTPSRRLRFAEVTDRDVHVYESQPPSPKKQPLALLPPSEPGASDVVSLGSYRTPRVLPKHAKEVPEDPEEGTPEYIRRRFFPSAPRQNASLAWMDVQSEVPQNATSSDLRFDLSGKPIPRELWDSLPTHLGLHHHAGSAAGYTLDDLFLLSRSTVPAQRVTVLDVLGKIVQRTGQGELADLGVSQGDLRKRLVAAGAEALSSTGSLGARAVQAIWECLVGSNSAVDGLEGVELQEQPAVTASTSGLATPVPSDLFSTLPMTFLLQQIAEQLASPSLPYSSLIQLLDILHRIAHHTNDLAAAILSTPNLISNIIRLFISPSTFGADIASTFVDSHAVQLLTTLASAFRSNAAKLLEIGAADALLRFIAILPPASTLPEPLATSFLAQTLRFYAVLAQYGLYAHTGTVAQTHFHALRNYVFSEACASEAVWTAWLILRDAWTVCAIDPHRTTPDHDILWSQVVGWGWQDDLSEMRTKLIKASAKRDVWTAYLNAVAAWLEGVRVNGAKGGENERRVGLQELTTAFQDGPLSALLDTALGEAEGSIRAIHSSSTDPTCSLDQLQDLSTQSLPMLSSALRVCIACAPAANEDGSFSTPPLPLPFPRLDALAVSLLRLHSWDTIVSSDTPAGRYVLGRSFSAFALLYMRLAFLVRAIPPERWLALSSVLFTRLSPGDEDAGQWLMEQIAKVVNEGFMKNRSLVVPSVIWERGGLSCALPFLVQSLQPRAEADDEEPHRVGPAISTPVSIKNTTTLRLPSPFRRAFSSLPLRADWPMTPLDHLLRSAVSPVFHKAGLLPLGWDASETDVARAALLLAKLMREVLGREGWIRGSMTSEDAIFGCMKVFMLEHGQQEDAADEVFRDTIVGQFMEDIVAPFTLSSLPPTTISPSAPPGKTPHSADLETVAKHFLGPSTPFFQFYTDFVGLYDSISFSHPLFARLLLPPTSMRYAIDYRKHLWGDYAHILKTIRVPIDAVITGHVQEWLWPVEDEPEMVGWYLRALLKHPLEGFVRWVAVHHIACNIWTDLSALNLGVLGVGAARNETEGSRQNRATKLLQVIAEQGSLDVLRDVVSYTQVGPLENAPTLVPPACFQLGEMQKSPRLMLAKRISGDDLEARFLGLFKSF